MLYLKAGLEMEHIDTHFLTIKISIFICFALAIDCNKKD